MTPEMITPLLESASAYGFPMLFAVFILYAANKQAMQRESKLVDRIERLEDFQRNELSNLLKTTALALEDSAEALKTNENSQKELLGVLKHTVNYTKTVSTRKL